MAKFFETESKLTENQIRELEVKLNFDFPSEYQHHLLQYNGGKCEPNMFSFNQDGIMNESFIDWFLAIYDGEFDNLEKYFLIYKIEEKRMPATIFPIAHDPLGNLICMDKTDNKIYFWDHESEVDYNISDDTDKSNLYLIANNLDEFLSSLR